MNLNKIIPPWHAMAREIILVSVGILGTAWLISRFPKAKQFVTDNSVTLKDGNGDIII